jgi:hypothetical protein
LRHRGDHRGHALSFAVRREGHLEAFVAGGLGQRFEFERQPAVVVGAHVHRQRLGDGAEAARLLGTVDPGFERPAAAFLVDLADE